MVNHDIMGGKLAGSTSAPVASGRTHFRRYTMNASDGVWSGGYTLSPDYQWSAGTPLMYAIAHVTFRITPTSGSSVPLTKIGFEILDGIHKFELYINISEYNLLGVVKPSFQSSSNQTSSCRMFYHPDKTSTYECLNLNTLAPINFVPGDWVTFEIYINRETTEDLIDTRICGLSLGSAFRSTTGVITGTDTPLVLKAPILSTTSTTDLNIDIANYYVSWHTSGNMPGYVFEEDALFNEMVNWDTNTGLNYSTEPSWIFAMDSKTDPLLNTGTAGGVGVPSSGFVAPQIMEEDIFIRSQAADKIPVLSLPDNNGTRLRSMFSHEFGEAVGSYLGQEFIISICLYIPNNNSITTIEFWDIPGTDVTTGENHRLLLVEFNHDFYVTSFFRQKINGTNYFTDKQRTQTGTDGEGWYLFLVKINNTDPQNAVVDWCRLNKTSSTTTTSTFADHDSVYVNNPDRAQEFFVSIDHSVAHASLWPKLRSIYYYPYTEITGNPTVPWNDPVAFEALFYEGATMTLKNDLLNAVEGVTPFTFIDTVQKKGAGYGYTNFLSYPNDIVGIITVTGASANPPLDGTNSGHFVKEMANSPLVARERILGKK